MKPNLAPRAYFPGWSALLLAFLLHAFGAHAAPGAHGPNGEHLDGPVQQGAASSAPRLEASSELFELVATLRGGELSVLVDRFATNEPVLGANVEVETGSLKAIARFQADLGDYAVQDAAMLQALAQPGEHALVFTVTAGPQMDLLDGTLRTAPAAVVDDHGHDRFFTPGRIASAVLALVLVAAIAAVLLRRRRRNVGGLQ